MELTCKVQNYGWGKLGKTSIVANLLDPENTATDENRPYAELWMGTHVNGPSSIKSTGVPLADFLKDNPQYIGQPVIETFGATLPYLFKVLSIRSALSIQAHPTKELAQELHLKYPDIYKDPNHKPELAIALTPFEVLSGFRPIDEIRKNIRNIPELGSIVGEQIQQIEDDCIFLSNAFKAVFTCSKSTLHDEIQNMMTRFSVTHDIERQQEYAPLVERLHCEYPNDVGLFMVYFLNYIKMQPSEAIYLGASKIHAYISGDCIECMACSDNVVRAGLTPKFIDVDTLLSMAIYKGDEPSDILFKPIKEDVCTNVYRPPVPDFAVAHIRILKENSPYDLIPRSSASILVVTSGSGTDSTGLNLVNGKVIFLPADQILTINATEFLTIYQAFANL